MRFYGFVMVRLTSLVRNKSLNVNLRIELVAESIILAKNKGDS